MINNSNNPHLCPNLDSQSTLTRVVPYGPPDEASENTGAVPESAGGRGRGQGHTRGHLAISAVRARSPSSHQDSPQSLQTNVCRRIVFDFESRRLFSFLFFFFF